MVSKELGIRSEKLGIKGGGAEGKCMEGACNPLYLPPSNDGEKAANELETGLRRIAELLRSCEPRDVDKKDLYNFGRNLRLILELLTPEEV